MLPSFAPGDRVLLLKWGTVHQGDCVIFYKNGLKMLKRAVHKKGSRWTMRGENFSASTDSADFGDVEEASIIGKVLLKY